MAYESYKKIMSIFFSLYLPIFMLNIFGEYIIESWETSFIYTANYYVYRVLTIFLLFFSIYARLLQVKTPNNASPSMLIGLGAILAILAFTPPILNYYFMTDIKLEAPREMYSGNIRKDALNISIPSRGRLFLAKKYYLDTGEKILYLNDDNKEVPFSPDDETIKRRNKAMAYEHQIDLLKANARITALRLIGILVVLIVSFLIFLWYKFKKQRTTLGT